MVVYQINDSSLHEKEKKKKKKKKSKEGVWIGNEVKRNKRTKKEKKGKVKKKRGRKPDTVSDLGQ